MNKNQERDVSFRLPMESCEGGPVVSLPGADAWNSLGLQPRWAREWLASRPQVDDIAAAGQTGGESITHGRICTSEGMLYEKR